MRIILASASPRRKELLSKIIDKFEVIPSKFNEELVNENSPQKLVERLSYEKAEEVLKTLELKEDFIIISADTVVSCNTIIMGKPKDKQDAYNMLKELQGNVNTVHTGMTIIYKIGNKIKKKIVYTHTNIYFKQMSDNQILEYINSGEPVDKAGAYAIQGLGNVYIDKIDGNFNSVVGLDIEKLEKILNNIFAKIK